METALQKATVFTSYMEKSHLTGAEDVVGVGIQWSPGCWGSDCEVLGCHAKGRRTSE